MESTGQTNLSGQERLLGWNKVIPNNNIKQVPYGRLLFHGVFWESSTRINDGVTNLSFFLFMIRND